MPQANHIDLAHPDLSFVADLPKDMGKFLLHRLEWLRTARWNQLPPPNHNWVTWLALAGRGFGKTRCGAEFVADEAMKSPGIRVALIGPTAVDPCRVMVEGESGLLSILGQEGEGIVKKWNRSTTELFLENGTLLKGYSSEEPGSLRGPQHHLIWGDELCAWKKMVDTYDMARMGLRLGLHPQMIITSTPKPSKLLKGLIADPSTVLVTGSTYENEANLPQIFMDDLKRRYEGTRLGAQELYARILEDFDDAFLKHEEIGHVERPPELGRIVIAVDPAGTHRKDADTTGIIAAGIEDPHDKSTHGFVLADYSLRAPPEVWGRRVVEAYHSHEADLIVAEKNYGGEMVASVIKNVDPNVPVKLVTATKGKTVRAEPVLMLYQQNRIFHVGHFPELEEQITAFTPKGYQREGSPDRGDACVWAFTELLLHGSQIMSHVSPLVFLGHAPWRLN